MGQRTRVGAYGVITHDDHVLLTELAIGPSKGSFSLPGGGIDFGESPEQAFRRELLEEVGLRVGEFELLTVVSERRQWTNQRGATDDVHYLGVIFRVRLSARPELRLTGDGQSCASAKWFSRAELPSVSVSEPARAALVSAGLLPGR